MYGRGREDRFSAWGDCGEVRDGGKRVGYGGVGGRRARRRRRRIGEGGGREGERIGGRERMRRRRGKRESEVEAWPPRGPVGVQQPFTRHKRRNKRRLGAKQLKTLRPIALHRFLPFHPYPFLSFFFFCVSPTPYIPQSLPPSLSLSRERDFSLGSLSRGSLTSTPITIESRVKGGLNVYRYPFLTSRQPGFHPSQHGKHTDG